jgi:hypothetical protein
VGTLTLTLKEWIVDFDPMREPVDKKKVWAILPGLPLAFWSKEALEAIGNKIGIFIKLEPNWFSKPDRRWAWVQVEVDTREGLVGSMDLVMGSKIWHQKVDYWKIPFWCHGCHEIGHLKSNCNRFSPHSLEHYKIWRRKSTLNRKEFVDSVSLENGKIAEVVLQAAPALDPEFGPQQSLTSPASETMPQAALAPDSRGQATTELDKTSSGKFFRYALLEFFSF